MKVLVAPDKFKGSLTSAEAASLIGKAFKNNGFEVITSPLADGGEGTVDAIVSAVGGRKKIVPAKGPLGRSLESFIGLIKDGKEAVIEMAAASGLNLLGPAEYNLLKTSTYGTGELIKAALDEGVDEILIGVGGSATNDAGMGAAKALGAEFLDEAGNALEPVGENLGRVKKYDLSGMDPRIEKTKILVAVDVENPFYGEQGAAHVYGPQKGADQKQVEFLDSGLVDIAEVIENQSGQNLQKLPGSGAAGGLAGGLVAFLGARITPGTKYISDLLQIGTKVLQVDLVVTGEGKVDEQTLYGKAPTGVFNEAKKHSKKVIMIAGQIGEGVEKLEEEGIEIYMLAKGNRDAKWSMENPEKAIELTVEEIVKSLKADS